MRNPILLTGTGIYKIVNRLTGKIYIGSAVNLSERWRLHKHHLDNKTHRNRYLQNAWDKYGEFMFSFEPLINCEKEDLLDFEQDALDAYQSYDREIGYNINHLATNSLGVKRSDETKKKISESGKGRIPWNKGLTKDDPRVKKYADKNKNRIVTEEQREKIRKTLTGYKHTEEAKKNMSGRELSDEHKKAISNYMTGKKHTLGRKHTDEWKQEAKIRMSKRKRDSKGRMMKGVIQ